MSDGGDTGGGGVNDDSVVFRNKKKKPRYSRAQKRERKEQQQQEQTGNDATTQSQQQQHQQRKKKKTTTKKKKPSALERIQACIDQSLHTGSVVIDSGASTPITPTTITTSTIGIVSGCDFEATKQKFPSIQADSHMAIASTIASFLSHNETIIRVQPLLILDLNGILCHRSRQRKEPPGSKITTIYWYGCTNTDHTTTQRI